MRLPPTQRQAPSASLPEVDGLNHCPLELIENVGSFQLWFSSSSHLGHPFAIAFYYQIQITGKGVKWVPLVNITVIGGTMGLGITMEQLPLFQIHSSFSTAWTNIRYIICSWQGRWEEELILQYNGNSYQSLPFKQQNLPQT